MLGDGLPPWAGAVLLTLCGALTGVLYANVTDRLDKHDEKDTSLETADRVMRDLIAEVSSNQSALIATAAAMQVGIDTLRETEGERDARIEARLEVVQEQLMRVLEGQ